MAEQLFAAQASAGSLPRLSISPAPVSDDVLPFLPAILLPRSRRPTRVLQYGEDAFERAGIFWELEDFHDYKTLGPNGLQWTLLVECQEAEKKRNATV